MHDLVYSPILFYNNKKFVKYAVKTLLQVECCIMHMKCVVCNTGGNVS